MLDLASSVTPIFVKNQQDIESAIDKINEKIQNHPDIILLKQQLKAKEEILNKYVDENDDGERLKKCLN